MANEGVSDPNTLTVGSESARSDEDPKSIDIGIELSITSSDSTNGIATPAVTEAEVTPEPELPPWFLKGCVKTLEELTALNAPLKVYGPLSDKDNSIDPEAEESDHYAVTDVIYESLFDLVSPLGESEGHQEDSEITRPRKFIHDAMVLRMPHIHRGHRFLELVVQHFAKDVGADIIGLSLNDIENLAMHFATISGHTLPDGMTAFRDLYFVEPEKPSKEPKANEGKQETSALDDDTSKCIEIESDKSQGPETRKKLPFPFERIFASVSEKRNSQDTVQGQDDRPVIILVHEVADKSDQPRNILTHLRDAVKDARAQGKDIAVVAIDTKNDSVYGYNWRSPSEDKDFLSDLGSDPVKVVQEIVPIRNKAQGKLLKEDQKKTVLTKNIQMLQRKIHEDFAIRSFPGLLEPHVDWEFSEESFAAERLSDPKFGGRELELVAYALSRNITAKNVERAFERLNILNEWMVGDKDEKKTPGRWDNFHESAQKAIKEIQSDSCKYKYENDLLDSIVASDAVEQSWNDIEVDEDTKDTIKQLVDLANTDPKSQYGLLSKSRIRGALLYGPPGTGKTQLARVLAHEYKAVMIHVSVADIENMYVGETEKMIKGLFNLASMVAPSIIFIDEADALFRKRGAEDRSWERSRLNELLNQQDGLTAAKMPPFLLLATNHPNDMDDAVMRRVPARLHIGLPTSAAREKIFDIFLRDETVEPNLELTQLAACTPGFTGSDIKTICTQAALICQNELDKSGKPSETRVLTRAHFDAALARTGPTVSSNALQQIRDFAKKFDPSAIPKMDRTDTTANSARGALDSIWSEYDNARGKKPGLNDALDRLRRPDGVNYENELLKFKQYVS